ncbi:MAG TPA: chemotaxis protein CheB [Chloroflexota bacterium]|nr:chemotaxis protein CheB [Chloroflexota bacterium]
MIRVLVVAEPSTQRDFLVQALASDARFQIVAIAVDGHEAARLTAQLRPDVIAMNLILARLDGIDATRRIMAETPTPIVIFGSTVDGTPTATAAEVLQAGAMTVVDQPLTSNGRSVHELLTTLRLMSEVKVVRRPASGAHRSLVRVPLHEPTPLHAIKSRRPVVVLVAASTGGPQAIQTLLRALGPDLDVPVLVVQHMSSGFLAGMVGWLAGTCPQSVRLAAHGDDPAGGTVYIAPEDYHLLVSRTGNLALSKAPPVGGFRPSANTLFESAAQCHRGRAIGAVLTGMGDDGAAGLAALRGAGASTIAQDEDSAVVFGMPRAAAGAAERVLPLAAIGPAVRRLLGLKLLPHVVDSQADASWT